MNQLGECGLKGLQASKKKSTFKKEAYSLSLISAISYDQVLANQFIEGGVDSTVFENFIYELLVYIKNDPQLKSKRVVLLMDNARIHSHMNVI
jgi:hypothetical protein